MRHSMLLPIVTALAAGCGSHADSTASGSAGVALGPSGLGNLVLWLDATSGVIQSAGAVSEWEDQSGNGNNVSQTAAPNQPTYHAAGAGPNGGLPYLTFGSNGSNVFLDNTLKNLTPASSDVTVVVAANLPRGGLGGVTLTLGQSAPFASFMYVNTFDGDYAYSDGANVSSNDGFAAPPLPVTGTPVILDYTYHQGTSVVLDVDGTPVHNTGIATAYTGAAGFTVGSREDLSYQGWQGDIYEVLVYQGILSAANLAAARNYVASEWGISVESGPADAGACPQGLTLCDGTCVPWQDGSACTAPALPSSWRTPAWYIDPANSTGKASDSNACTTAAKPCLTYARVATLWGTYSPTLAQNTTVTFLSSQPDDTDPVYFNPLIENDVSVTLQGALGAAQQVASGALSNVVAKTRSAGQLWQATLPSGAAPGQLVVNGTRTSRAWIYKSAGASNWLLSQPLASNNLASIFPPETDNWANGDAVVLYQPVTVDLAQAMPLTPGGNIANENLNLTIYQITVADGSVAATSATQDDLQINNNLLVVESSIRKTVSVEDQGKEYESSFANVDFSQSVLATATELTMSFWGGQTRHGTGQIVSLPAGDIGADIIVSGEWDVSTGNVYSAFIDTGSVFVARSSFLGAYAYGSPIGFWGPGAVDVVGNARLEYPPSDTAVSLFLQTGGLFLNVDPTALEGATAPVASAACSVAPSGTWTCGIPLTPANLDKPVASGGFGGTAVNPGGASVTCHGTLDSTTN